MLICCCEHQATKANFLAFCLFGLGMLNGFTYNGGTLMSALTSADRFQDRLSIPKKAVPTIDPDGVPHFRLEMKAFTHDFHNKLPNIPVWGYNSFPSETIVAEVSKPVRVTWFNTLTGGLETVLKFGQHFGMEVREPHMLEKAHNVVHLHGARVQPTSDGHPDRIFHPNEGAIYYYPNHQAAATLWYHDHSMDVTRLNVYAGLFGAYLLRSSQENTVLPKDDFEIPLILQDKSFNTAGTFLEYQQTAVRENGKVTVTPEFIGDYPVVNGKIWPYFEVEPRVYRFRIINGANTRFFNLTIEQAGVKHRFYQIGSDGGFLEPTPPVPVQLESLLLAPGERADVLVDFSGLSGNWTIFNDAQIPYPGDAPLTADDLCAQVMQFKLKSSVSDNTNNPNPATLTLPAYVDPGASQAAIPRSAFAAINTALQGIPMSDRVKTMTLGGRPLTLRRFVLKEFQIPMVPAKSIPGHGSGAVNVPTVKINGKLWQDNQPVKVKKDALEVWEFINVSPDAHPMHLHLVQFQILGRQEIKKSPLSYKNPIRIDPDANEQGWKDTVRCNPGEATRILVRFDGFTGEYVFHCHILEHEDMGMMIQLIVDN
jgi:spore coat protein A, manganese oxidase